MRTVHGQYRRKVKIPKDEVFGSSTNESAPPPVSPTPTPISTTAKKSPNKRKSSSPLKVKLPFKMASEKTKDENVENA